MLRITFVSPSFLLRLKFVTIFAAAILPNNTIKFYNMSKGNMLLGYARGKVGDMVFARRAGEQITRPYNGRPKNPQTRSQMTQRIKWPNVIAFYRVARPFIEKGMQGRKLGQSGYNKFVSLNTPANDVYLTKQMAVGGGSVIAPYYLTNGSLGERSISADLHTGIKFEVSDFDNMTLGDVSSSIVASNAGLMMGDQISVVMFRQSSTDAGLASVPYLIAAYATFTLQQSEANFFQSVESAGGLNFNTSPDRDSLIVTDALKNEYPDFCVALIVSRIVDGKLEVSTSRCTVVATADPSQQSYGFGVSAEAAIQSYGVNADVFLTPDII